MLCFIPVFKVILFLLRFLMEPVCAVAGSEYLPFFFAVLGLADTGSA